MYNIDGQENQIQKIAFFLLEVYVVIFLVGTHIFNEIALVLFGMVVLSTIVAYSLPILKIQRVMMPLLALLFYSLISIIWCVDKEQALSTEVTMLKCFLLTWAIVCNCTNRSKITKLLVCYVLACLALDMFCIFKVGLSGLAQMSYEEVRLGTGSVSMNSNSICFENAIGVSIVMYLESHYNKKAVYILLIPLCAICLFTASRGGTIILLLGIVLCMLLINRKYKFLWILATVIVAIAVIYYLGNKGLLGTTVSRFTSMFETFSGGNYQERSTSTRIELIKFGINLFIQNPIFGYGCGQFKYLSLNNFGVAWSPHNTYIQTAVSYGIFGLIFWQGNYIRIISNTMKKKNYDNLAIIIGIICICWLIGDCFSHSLTDKVSYYILGIGLSFLTITSNGEMVDYEE